MSNIDDGGAAFPGESVERHGMHSTRRVLHDGMSLRDWFAGQAAMGILAFPGTLEHSTNKKTEVIARVSYAMADALIAARKGGAA